MFQIINFKYEKSTEAIRYNFLIKIKSNYLN